MNHSSVEVAARKYAAWGLCPIRVAARDKRPIDRDWPNAATSDAKAVAKMFAGHKGNVGLSMRNHIAVDVDSDEGARWLDDVAAKARAKLPVTMTTKTAKGRHLVFKLAPGQESSAIGNGVRVAPGIDIRTGEAGQVIAWPSIHPTGVPYSLEVDAPPAPCPDWLWMALVSARAKRHTPPPPRAVPAPDADGKYVRMRAWLREAERSIDGQGGSNALMRALGKVCAQGLTPDQEWELACEYNSTKCDGPWSESDLRRALDNARREGRGTPLEERSRRPHANTRASVGERDSAPAPAGDRAAETGSPEAPRSPEWEPIIPFGHYELPPFPVERLPPALRAMVTATAAATQTPPDMAGMLTLTALSVCCGGRVEVQVTPDYFEPLNSYVAVVMEPGNRKTAVVRIITAPIEDFERDQLERLGPRVARERAEREALEERLSQLKKAAGRAEDPDERQRLLAEVGDVAEQLARTARPELPRLLADDVTPEAVPLLMVAGGGRLGIVSAEGGLLDTMAGRYTNNVPNLDVFLKGHAGDPVRVDRKGGTCVHIDAPALTIGLAIQPDVLHGMSSKPGFAGRGLIPRFWFSVPTSLVGSRQSLAPAVPEADRREYAECLGRLLAAPGPNGMRPRLTLAPAALDAWRAFYTDNERNMRPDGELATIREWASKLPGAVIRIAGLLSCAHTGEMHGSVAADTMEGAIVIGRYLAAHARVAHDAMGMDPEVEDAKRFIAWLERRNVAAFSLRDAYQALKSSRVRKVQDLEPALRAAEAHAYIRPVGETGPRGPGRPASPRYETNPQLLRQDAKAAPRPAHGQGDELAGDTTVRDGAAVAADRQPAADAWEQGAL